MGGLDLDCTKVWLPVSGTVYALVNGQTNTANAGVNGIYRFPQLAGDPDMTASGYAGWTYVHTSGTIIDAAGDDAALYYADTEAPDTITLVRSGVDDPTAIKTSMGEHILGLDYNPATGNIFVRTEAGAAGLYSLHVGSTALLNASPVPPNTPGALADSFGYVATGNLINCINNATGAPPIMVNGQPVSTLVATDRSVWWSPAVTQGPWNPAAGQSGIDTSNVAFVAIGQPQTVLGRLLVRLYAIAGNGLYISDDGGLNWRDEMAQPLDGGAGWQALAMQITGDYADNTIGGLGNISTVGEGALGSGISFQDTGGTGGTILIPSSNPFALPFGWIIARRFTARNNFTFRLVDTQSAAPYNAIKLGEAIEIQADDTRGVVTASSELIVAAYRFLAQANRPQLVLPLRTQCRTQQAALWRLLTGDQVLLDLFVKYPPTGANATVLANFQKQVMYLIQWDGVDSGNGLWDVTLQVANSTAFLLLTFEEIVSGVANGQAKDRRSKGVRIR